MGPTALLPLRRRRPADFTALRSSSPSTGFEPTNLGSNGKHTNHYTTEDELMGGGQSTDRTFV
jgi:hypothetical protein